METTETVTVYANADVNSTIIGTQPQGAVGVITRGPHERNGMNWAEVDFDTGADGFVDADLLVEVDDGDPGGDPPGEIDIVGIFGCSNTGNDFNDGIDQYSIYSGWGPNNQNRGKTIVSYGEPNGDGAFDHVRDGLANNPGTDLILYGLCHRYSADPLPGARTIDSASPLPAGQSGSDSYSEDELTTRIAEKLRNVVTEEGFPDIPIYFFALHQYDAAGTCLRVGV